MASKRMLSKNICVSDKINQLTWFQEVLYYRILVNADDLGCFYSTEGTVKEICFPRNEVSLKAIKKGIAVLKKVGLVEQKEHKRRAYLQLKEWGKYQILRADRRKHSLFGLAPDVPEDIPMVRLEDKAKDKAKAKVIERGNRKRDSAVHKFLEYFSELWNKEVSTNDHKYHISWGKDGRLVKLLLDTYSINALQDLAVKFFESDDEFIKQSGFTIGVFSSVLPKLIARKETKGEKDKRFADEIRQRIEL